MKSFIITLISVAFLNGAVGMISPEGDIKNTFASWGHCVSFLLLFHRFIRLRQTEGLSLKVCLNLIPRVGLNMKASTRTV